jgi:hypothetical protein
MKAITSISILIVSIFIGLISTIAYATSVEQDNVAVNAYAFAPRVDLSLIQRDDLYVPFIKENVVIPTVQDKRVPKDKTKRCPKWESKFKEYGLPVDVFSYIAWRESKCNPKAINAKFDANGNVTWTLNKNGSIDRGLVQINSCWRSVTKKVCGTNLNGLLGIDCNLKVAKYIMDNSEGKLLNWRIQN